MKPSLGACFLLFALASAHGQHSHEDTVRPEDDWALYHMQEEHRTSTTRLLDLNALFPSNKYALSADISNFDPSSFFSLHDFNNDGVWTPDEVRRTYGLDDESLRTTAGDVKDKAVLEVFKIFDLANSGVITRDQWLDGVRAGKKLPDSGLGPGHHGDDEYEYEIHHFEKFHDENTKEEDLIHPEDIAHFKKHDMMEDEAERVLREQRQNIVEKNIPMKFRKQQ
ncbi:hypothetical protein H2204_008338 [Knufia peltigerae]|uniref:EF-hand domain-containing protein n=1 Tax=Knufia peltigerae TaxID=1002370 RepID=A0AA38Y1A5_9EURO|nr:hypothetical protein H2204_008338 [Knufia peltigerae]